MTQQSMTLWVLEVGNDSVWVLWQASVTKSRCRPLELEARPCQLQQNGFLQLILETVPGMLLSPGGDWTLEGGAPRDSVSGTAYCELGYVGSTESKSQTGPAAEDHKMEKVHQESSPERARGRE